MFAYKVPGASPLNQAIFVRYKLINYGSEPMDSVYVGLFTDFHLGNPYDDFIGSAPGLDMMFGYNGDANDEGGFGSGAPAMGVALLRGPLAPQGQDSLIEIPLRHVIPVENTEDLFGPQFYNLLAGRFADGTPAPNDGLLYTGNPNDPAGWSEVTAGNTPGDRAGLASYGPFQLLPGAVNEVIAAYLYAYTPGATPVQNVQSLYDQVGILHQAFDNCFEGLDPTCDEAVPASEPHLATGLSLYPNPATTEFILESRNSPLQSIVLSDLAGRTITTIHPAPDTYRQTVPLAGLAPGLYLVQVNGTMFKVVRGER